MRGSALKIDQMTTEQKAAYSDAMHTADRLHQRQQRDISEAEFERIYFATLHDHLLKALKPVRDMQLRCSLLTLHPGVIVHPDGRYEFMVPPRMDKLDQLEADITERFTKGLV